MIKYFFSSPPEYTWKRQCQLPPPEKFRRLFPVPGRQVLQFKMEDRIRSGIVHRSVKLVKLCHTDYIQGITYLSFRIIFHRLYHGLRSYARFSPWKGSPFPP